MFTCKYCGHEFKNKTSHDRHHAFCEFQSTCDADGDPEMAHPPVHVMFGFMKEMMYKIQCLERDNQRLRQHMYRSARKIDAVKWLNVHVEDPIHIRDWLGNIDYADYIDITVSQGLHVALRQIIEHYIESCPIKTMQTKRNVYYVYEDKWVMYTPAKIKKLLQQMTDDIATTFQENHTLPLDADEDTVNHYMCRLDRVLGSSKDDRMYPALCALWHERSVTDIA